MCAVSRAQPATPTTPDPSRASLRPVGGFLLRFVGGWIVVLAVAAWTPGIEQWAVRNTIASLGVLSALLRLAFHADGNFVQMAGASVQIVPDCTPLMPAAALWISIFAFPSAWKWKWIGALAGLAVLWVYNLLRILALVPVLIHRPEWFEFIHVYLWQTMTLLVVFGLFVLWLGLQRRKAAA
jgi:exosortase/archaeosortase family protein